MIGQVCNLPSFGCRAALLLVDSLRNAKERHSAGLLNALCDQLSEMDHCSGNSKSLDVGLDWFGDLNPNFECTRMGNHRPTSKPPTRRKLILAP